MDVADFSNTMEILIVLKIIASKLKWVFNASFHYIFKDALSC